MFIWAIFMHLAYQLWFPFKSTKLYKHCPKVSQLWYGPEIVDFSTLLYKHYFSMIKTEQNCKKQFPYHLLPLSFPCYGKCTSQDMDTKIFRGLHSLCSMTLLLPHQKVVCLSLYPTALGGLCDYWHRENQAAVREPLTPVQHWASPGSSPALTWQFLLPGS